jgi:hypothetical protein
MKNIKSPFRGSILAPFDRVMKYIALIVLIGLFTVSGAQSQTDDIDVFISTQLIDPGFIPDSTFEISLQVVDLQGQSQQVASFDVVVYEEDSLTVIESQTINIQDSNKLLIVGTGKYILRLGMMPKGRYVFGVSMGLGTGNNTSERKIFYDVN